MTQINADMALYEKKDTSKPINPKKAFDRYWKKKGDKRLDKQLQKCRNTFQKSKLRSKKFVKSKALNQAMEWNNSLQAFVLSIRTIIND